MARKPLERRPLPADLYVRRTRGARPQRPAEAPPSATVVHGGMGAIPYRDDAGATGVAFRVWAPHADAVEVEGSFNDWTGTRAPLAREEHGYWYAAVPGAAVGDEYKFVIRNGEQVLHRIDPYARQVTNSIGNGVVYDHGAFDWQGDAFTAPPLNEMVIYELHVGSFFADGDGPGNFASVLEKIGHLKRLGVNVIQVMPVAEFAGDYSWGYNPAHLFAVESAYGGPDAFKTFVREVHRHGIAVILDVVYNHFGPSDLDLWQFDGWSENDKGGIYFYNDHRAETPWGSTRPDFGRGEVRQFIRDNALSWLEDFHVDGLRFDMTLYIRSVGGFGDDDIADGWGLVQWVNREIRERHPHAITIAEDLRSNDWVTKAPEDGGAGFHSQWDENFVHPVRSVVIVADDQYRSMDAVRDALEFSHDGDAFRRIVYSESHDEVANGRARVPQEINPGDASGWFAQKRSTLAAGLVFTAPGVPMLFQGQEFLQGEWFRDDVPLDWDLTESFHGILRMYRDLVALRRNLRGRTRGLQGQSINVFHVNDALNVIGFQRWWDHGPGDDVVVVMNFSAEAREDYRIGLPTGGLWRVRLNSDSRWYADDFGDHPAPDVQADDEAYDGFGASAAFALAPYSFLILSQDPPPDAA